MDLVLLLPGQEATEIVRKPTGYNGNVLYEGGRLRCKSGEESNQIVYPLENDGVFILRAVHGSRDLPVLVQSEAWDIGG